MQTEYEVAGVIRQLGDDIQELKLTVWQHKTLRAIRDCRTQALGGHIDVCTDCGTMQISYNSCRNRHCPKCQGHKKEEWINARTGELLPVPYFHVVFTLPDLLNSLVIQESKKMYDLLFESVWDTLQTFGRNKGLKMGMISILHTWGQNLSLHPHVHCIVPGGGIDAHGHFDKIRTDGKFLFSVKAMGKVFRAKYVAMLRREKIAPQELISQLFQKPWVVYAKRPFGNVKSVIVPIAIGIRTLYPQDSHIQSQDQKAGLSGSYIYIQGLSTRRHYQGNDIDCKRIYTSVCTTYFTQKICSHPALWIFE